MSGRKSTSLETRMTLLAPAEGINATLLPGVFLQKVTRELSRSPAIYRPGIKFVVSGSIQAHLGRETYRYDKTDYLVQTVALPVECEIEASPAEPVVLIWVDLDLPLIRELLLESEKTQWYPAPADAYPAGICTAPMSGPLRDAVKRLLSCLRSPIEARVLGPAIVREIIFRVMRGDHGGTLAATVAHQSGFRQINRVLNRMNRDFRKPVDIDSLAREASMSVSAFHRAFKSLTSTSPQKYLQSIRLHKARSFLGSRNYTVAGVAERVGYESVSQFSREFKRLFGSSPARDAKRGATGR